MRSPVPIDPHYTFRLFRPRDLPDLRELYGHAESVRYMSADGRPWTDVDLTRAIVAWQEEFHRVGYTKWRVDTGDGVFVGRAGLSPLEGAPEEAELGYCVVREAWGKGIATELATIVRDWAWENTCLPYLIGVTRPGNTASQRVLFKIGMKETGQLAFQGSMCQFFRVDRPTSVEQATDNHSRHRRSP